jgi:hypothetical protein
MSLLRRIFGGDHEERPAGAPPEERERPRHGGKNEGGVTALHHSAAPLRVDPAEAPR